MTDFKQMATELYPAHIQHMQNWLEKHWHEKI